VFSNCVTYVTSFNCITQSITYIKEISKDFYCLYFWISISADIRAHPPTHIQSHRCQQ